MARSASAEVPFAAASVSQARHRLKDWLVDRNAPAEAVEDARVVISELVANSVRHAQALPDGNLLISEINGSWVSEYTRTGKLV